MTSNSSTSSHGSNDKGQIIVYGTLVPCLVYIIYSSCHCLCSSLHCRRDDLPGLFFIIIFLTLGGRPGGWQESTSSYPFLPLAASVSPPDTPEHIWLRSSSLTFSSSLTTGCLHFTCSESWAQKWLSNPDNLQASDSLLDSQVDWHAQNL